MIYVTQGHQKGIGLEVFIKSLIDTPEFTNSLKLICYKQTLLQTLDSLNLNYSVSEAAITFNNIRLKTVFLEQSNYTESMGAIDYSIKEISKSDILFTLPTSKDQLIYKGQSFAGHTELLRFVYDQPLLAMSFWGPSHQQLLLTDHIPLSEVCSELTPRFFSRKISLAIENMHHYFPSLKNIYIAGINPHAGEGGIIGKEELLLSPEIVKIRDHFSDLFISDFLSGDTLHTYKSKDSLFVYMYHDQGLARFKSENNFIGINATLGLPFLRASVDHGTAFDLYGKNSADYKGCLYALKKLVEINAN